ncbi:rod shape-determining protein MreC [Brevibacillus sp. SYSU BS000544]|uniref:rod shape-determining protein MreC n=1 Tax=Brevibacillus sp. SYSU BS000544 TaxID=3416443 RepID=UPI003CE58E99
MSFFTNKRLIIVLVGLIFLMAIMGITSKERTELSWPEKLVKDTFSVVQGFFYTPAQAFSGFVEDVREAYHIYQENRVLKASLDQYAQVTAQLKLAEAENQRLRNLLNAKSKLNDYQLRVGEVVARNSDNWNDVVTIDKGLQNGIKKDMAVITSSGLIGRVQSVSNFSSTVELLTAMERSNHISAIILGEKQVNGVKTYSEVNGVIEEYDSRERLLIMRKIQLDAKVEPNQQVVTSGMGGVMPRGLLVGRIVRVVPGDYGLTQTAYIQPSADFTQLNEVMVVERSFITTSTGDLIPSNQANQTSGSGGGK